MEQGSQIQQIIATLDAHRKDLERFSVKSLSVFGSAARGEMTDDSDIDILVEFNALVGFFEFLDLKDYLEQILERRVDLVTRDALKRQLRDAILREAARAF